MKNACLFAIFFIGSLCSFASAASVASAPRVVVSITPFHALVAGVMCGVGTPELLVRPGASEHDFSLRPTKVRELHEADIIFWGGPGLETYLIKPLNTVQKAQIVELQKTPDLLLLPVRTSPNWEPHVHGNHAHENHAHGELHEHGEGDGHEHDDHEISDMHFWMDLHNAALMTDKIQEILSEKDPHHKAIYKKNSESIKNRLLIIDKKIKEKLASVQNVPFLVFHDGYQYFEHRYHLNGIGAITLHPEYPIGLERLTAIRNTIQKSKAKCIFSEPQFSPKLVDELSRELHVKKGVLDPLGPKTPECAEGYFNLLENLSNSIYGCLAE